jgi:hypothetical protein
MEQKWKFYKSVCNIDIAFLIVFNVLASGLAFAGGIVNKNDIIGFIVCVIISSICFIVDLQNIRLVNKFNSSQNIGKRFRSYLLIFYILLCPIWGSMAFLLFYSINSIYREYFSGFDIVTISLQLLMLFLFLSYLLKVMFTWILVKDVKENYKKSSNTINTIGIVST